MTESFYFAHVPKDQVPNWEQDGWQVCGDFEGTHHEIFGTVLMRRDDVEAS